MALPCLARNVDLRSSRPSFVSQFELSAALKVTTEAHVVEVLREEGTNGMHILTLAEKVGMEPQYLRERLTA